MDEQQSVPTIVQRLDRIEALLEELERHYLSHDHLNGHLVRKA